MDVATSVDTYIPAASSGGPLVGASGVSVGAKIGATQSGSGPLVGLSLDNLLAHSQLLGNRIRAAQHAMRKGSPLCDIPPNDAVALLTVADLMHVDVILESGTAGGRSTELMARFFEGTHVQITTVDFGSQTLGGACAAGVQDTHERMKAFPNVKALIGDSFKLFPRLVQENHGKRIGLFIDGPKGLPAAQLCMKMLKLSADVQYCLFHDVLPEPFNWGTSKHELYHFMEDWGRAVITSTCCADKWLSHFGLEYGLNSSVGVVVGKGLIPLGVKGDF